MSLSNFSWVIPDKLAGSDLPGSGVPTSHNLTADMEFLAAEGISMLVSLTRPQGNIKEICDTLGIRWRLFPIPDFGIPRANGHFSRLVEECIASLNSGLPVCVHCHAGIGRTGMVLSCIIGVYMHLNAEKSIDFVRRNRAAIETEEQHSFTALFLKAYES